MPDAALSLAWRGAALQLEAALREKTKQAPERLDQRAVRALYPRRRWVAAWRVRVTFPDNVVRRIDVVATAGFPAVPVRTALVDHPEFMTWPHVESDGVLCLLPNMAECDPDDPAAVAANLLNRSVRLVEELLEGTMVDRDFADEFLTYWAYKAHLNGTRLVSLLAPAPPSRSVRVWRGEGIEVVAEDAGALIQWVHRRYGAGTKVKTDAAAFLWTGQPLLPSRYPEKGSDLRELAASLGPKAASVLEGAAIGEPGGLTAVLGATGRGGAGLIGVKMPNPGKLTFPRRRPPPLRGFSPGRIPGPVLLDRLLGGNPVVRSSVQRADAEWVHGRGRDGRTRRLLESTVVLVGCGSVGAPVACALAQAGVGRIVMVDPNVLKWPNVGRHPLGATAVGRNKAEALADRLQADLPHLRIEGRPIGVNELLLTDPDLLESADLIVSATGSWAAESALNRWHVDRGRRRPVLYGWTEAHACAGHGVVVAAGEGCLKCHVGRTGTPAFRAVNWPDGGDANREEPACGAHYQPYGPIELGYVTAMLGELALDCLLRPPYASFSRVLVTSGPRIAELGGRWSEEWLADHGEHGAGVRTVNRAWPRSGCPACRGEANEEAA